MRIQRATALRRLHLETPKGTDLAFAGNDLLDPVRSERADQFIFKVFVARIEAKVAGVRFTDRWCSTTGQRAQKMSFFREVVQAGQAQPKPLNAEAVRKLACVRGATDRKHDDARGRKVQTNAAGQSFDRGLITPTFDQHDRVGLGLGDDALRAVDAQRRAWPSCKAIRLSHLPHAPSMRLSMAAMFIASISSAPARNRAPAR